MGQNFELDFFFFRYHQHDWLALLDNQGDSIILGQLYNYIVPFQFIFFILHSFHGKYKIGISVKVTYHTYCS